MGKVDRVDQIIEGQSEDVLSRVSGYVTHPEFVK